MTSLIHVGRRVLKLDAAAKETGAAEYGHDLRRPRMLYGRILRSAHAHARILNINTRRAKRLPGVKAVLTADDIAYIPFGFGKDNVALKCGKVRSCRDEIAAVAAVDEDTAEEALSLIQVDYEPLPAVFDPEEAMQPGAPLVHEERGTNIFKRYTFTHGDVEAAFAAAAAVVEGRFRLPFVTHTCMEPSVVVAEFDARGDLMVWSPTQIPHLLVRELAGALGLPGSRVRVLQPTIGGAFGSKLDMYPFEPIAVHLARATGCPVRIAYTREEEFLASPTRQPVIADVKAAAAKDGRLLARQARLILDNGAYTSWGATTPMIMMQTFSSLYRVPNVAFEATVVYTNHPYSGAMRGYGNPQPTFIVESLMDMLAESLGMDPLDFRLLNANQPGDVTPQRMRITTCGFRECLERAAAQIGWCEKRKTPAARAREHGVLRRGVGIAGVLHVGGGARIYRSDGCGAIVKVDDFGGVTVLSGASDMGQGTDVMLAQITAETLGVRPENVTVVLGDTAITPWDVGSHASRTTFIAGNAARLAAAKAKRHILEIAAAHLGENADDLDLRDGLLFRQDEPEETIPFAEIVRAGHFRPDGEVILAEAWYDPPNEMQDDQFYGNISVTWSFAAQAAEAEVDVETGQVRVLRVVSAHDIGRAINPMGAEGQIEGGIAMGLGYALNEELLLRDGQVLNPSLMDYRIATAGDMPEIEVIFVETNDPAGPFGAKGLGELCTIPTAPAIANAIYDAIGVRLTQLPMTPERVLRALAGMGDGNSR